MNFFHYLESIFVSNAIKQKNLAVGGSQIVERSKNEAVLAVMWVALKFATLFYIFLTVAKYALVALRLLPKPRAASVIAAEAQRAASLEQESVKQAISEMSQKKAMKTAMQDSGDAALLGLKKGSA